jgi:hypothetical protein
MNKHLTLTIPTTDPTLRRDLEQGVEEYADVTQAKSYTDLETVKLVLELVGEGISIAGGVAGILAFIRSLKQEKEQQGHTVNITIGVPGGAEVPIEQVYNNLRQMRIEVISAPQEAAVLPWELLRNPFTDTSVALNAGAFVRAHPQATRQARSVDSACGSGRFLTYALDYVRHKIADQLFPNEHPLLRVRRLDDDEQSAELVGEYARQCLYGIDFDPDLKRASRMNMLLNNDRHGNILSFNSLEYPTMLFRHEPRT